MEKDFYLLLDTCVCCAYAVELWLDTLRQHQNFKGVLLREEEPPASLLRKRHDFHQRYAGQRLTRPDLLGELRNLYPYLDEAEQAMIARFGLPKYAVSAAHNTFFLGKNINGSSAREWMHCHIGNTQPYLFSHLGQIIKPWLIRLAGGNLFNVHSAVLPYARGIYAIENIAASRDVAFFKQSAGATIHLIDEGVDTGPILRAYRIREPFQFDSIWDLKGFAYEKGYQLYADLAKRLLSEDELAPVPVASNPDLWGPNFTYKDFTKEQKRRAEEGYLEMKRMEEYGQKVIQ